MNDATLGQVSGNAAEIYDQFFVPALFQEWVEPVLSAAKVAKGESVLDVACGTGVVARAALDRVGPSGRVVGLDCNDGMLAVARRHEEAVRWQEGRAEALPFEDASFDVVTCQFGLMFFEDRVAALREMRRALGPGGRVAVVVWAGLDETPAFNGLVDLLDRLFGREVGDALRAPFCLGNVEALQSLFETGGWRETEIRTRVRLAHFPSIASWVSTNVKGWTYADQIDEEGMNRLIAESERELSRFVTQKGQVAFDSPARIVSATR